MEQTVQKALNLLEALRPSALLLADVADVEPVDVHVPDRHAADDRGLAVDEVDDDAVLGEHDAHRSGGGSLVGHRPTLASVGVAGSGLRGLNPVSGLRQFPPQGSGAGRQTSFRSHVGG